MNKFECIKGVLGSDLKPRARLVLQCVKRFMRSRIY